MLDIGDIQVELTKLVQSGVLDEKKFSFVSSLKAVQQELVYPAVMELRRGIYMDAKNAEKYPYKVCKIKFLKTSCLELTFGSTGH